MKNFIVRMWPGEPLPASYFGLIKRMVNACQRLEVIKRSVCIEGARQAFTCAKVHWGKLDAEKLVKDGPPEGKAHRCRGSRSVRLRLMVTGSKGHNVYPGSGSLDGGNTLLPA